MNQPIRLFYSELTGKIYASNNYTIGAADVCVVHSKDDVTSEVGRIVTKYRLEFTPVTPDDERQSLSHWGMM